MMSNIDKDIHMLKSYAGMTHKLTDNQGRPKLDQAIENVLEELEIKDKMIDEMATYLADMDFDDCCAEMPEPCLCCSWEDYEPHTQCIKEYFRKKAQNE